jgi:O-antigen/teichoic acid export membrane protein
VRILLNKGKSFFSPLKQKNGFLKSVLTLTSGTVIAQAITVIASPVITRLYTPADMGILASWQAIAAILGTVSTGCYDQAIVLPEREEEATALALLGSIIAISIGLLIFILSFFFQYNLIKILKLEGISLIWFYCIGLIIILTGIENILNRTAIRHKEFKILSFTQIIQQTSTNGIKIGAGIIRPGSGGLFLATIVGYFVRCTWLILNEKPWFYFQKKINFATIKNVAIRYKKFPLINIWGQFFNVASIQIPIVIFSTIFSADVVGYYSLSHRILSLPMSLIGSSVANVFLERAAKSRNNEEDLKRITLEIYKKLLLIGAISMSFVTFYGDKLFPFVFGHEWKEAGIYAQWISIWIIFQFSMSPISSIFSVIEKQGEGLFWQFILFLSRISILFIYVISKKNIVILISLYSLISAIIYFIFGLRILVITNNKIKTACYCIIKYVLSIYIIQYMFYKLISNYFIS